MERGGRIYRYDAETVEWVCDGCGARGKVDDLFRKCCSRGSETVVSDPVADVSKTDLGRMPAQVGTGSLTTDTLELVALTLTYYSDPSDSKIGNVIPQSIWDSLHERGLLRTGRDVASEGTTAVTNEGAEMLLRSITDLANAVEEE